MMRHTMDGLTHYFERIGTIANSLSAILGFRLMIREYVRWYREDHRPIVPAPERRTDRT